MITDKSELSNLFLKTEKPHDKLKSVSRAYDASQKAHQNEDWSLHGENWCTW